VKREDLCGVKGSPTFSKIRGIVTHLKYLKTTGITTVGYTETPISMAGWGVAWACEKLGLTCVIFEPIYKIMHEVQAYHREQWIKYNAKIIPIKAGMAKVNWYISKKLLNNIYENSVLLPLGLPFEETIQATAEEIKSEKKFLDGINNVVVNVGSGTILAGLLKGLAELNMNVNLIGVLGRTSNLAKKRKLIFQKANLFEKGLFGQSKVNLILIDPGWQYMDKSEIECPFECHPYYDLKAWQWLVENIKVLHGNTLFWNIGH
jgi:1-aminocyclopropane-1-carboxylate deaminase/D-cysteine desulfhydrase-like pyridoxal-dependent ACC family enzyme